MLTNSERELVLLRYDSVPEDKKWKLECSGKSVNDTMRAAAASAVYEHPVHSMILNPMDPIWKKRFTKKELTEIKLYRSREFSDLPLCVDNCLKLFDRDWENGLELFQFSSSLNYHPVNQFDEQWIEESMLGCCKLFLEKNVLPLKDPSEAGLLNKVWSFTYKLYQHGGIDAKLGEKFSASFAVGRNNSCSLSLEEKRPRKAMDAKVDTLYKYGQVEIGCSEVRKIDVSVVDDKCLDDGLVKLPKTLRDMLCLQAMKNPGQINHLRTFGLLMMGMDLQVLILDVPVGSSIVRGTRSNAFSFPNSLGDISSDFPSLLEITYKIKQALLENIKILNNKKRKAAVLYDSDGQDDELPFSFF